MNKNLTIGEYLAPEVKVVNVMPRKIVCTSTQTQSISNPFEDNEETDW